MSKLTLYAPSNIQEKYFNPAVGGCGRIHTAKAGERLAVDCPSCENVIRKYEQGHGWGNTPESAALTPDEEKQREADDARGKALLSSAGMALGEEVARLAAAKPAPKPRTRRAPAKKK
jgi:hypothetical protein